MRQALYTTTLIISILITCPNLFSQTGPGGVGTIDGTGSLKAWYDAEQNVSHTANAVTDWGNIVSVSELDVNTTASGADSPTLVTGSQNGYAAISFDGNDRLQTTNTLSSSYFPSSAGSIFMVALTDGTGNCTPYGSYPLSGQRYFGHLPWGGSYKFYHGGTNSEIAVPFNTSGLFIISAYLSNSFTQAEFFENNSSLGTDTDVSDFSEFDSHSFQFGDSYKGDIAEFIMFNEDVNSAQRNIINNYLGGKYNVALAANDMYAPDATYSYNITGIGQEADGSITSNRSAGWNFEFYSGNDDGEYLFLGHNNATNDVANIVSDANTAASGAEARWNRNWYFEKTGNSNITLSIDFSDAFTSGSTPIGNIQNYVLLYRSGTTGDYTAIKSAYNLINSDQLVFNLDDTDVVNGYYTIGTMDQTSSPVQGGVEDAQALVYGPAGIGNNLGLSGEGKIVMWLDADELSYADGDDVHNWKDKTGNNNNLLQLDNTITPVFKDNGIASSKSVIEFTPATNNPDRLVKYPFTQMPSDSITVLTVYKPVANTTQDGIISYALGTGSLSNEYLLINSSNLSSYVKNGQKTSAHSYAGDNWQILATAWRTSDGGAKIHKTKSPSSYYNSNGQRTGNSITSGGCWVIGGEQDDIDGGYTSQNLSGDVAEVIVYDDYLSDAEINVISNYLNLKYGDTDLPLDNDGFDNTAAGTHNQDFIGFGIEADGIMETRGSGGLYFSESIDMAVGDYMYGAHDGTINNDGSIDRTAKVTAATGVLAAWGRMYYIQKTGTQEAELAFDLPEAFENGKYFATSTDYVLLHRTLVGDNYSEVTATKALDGSSKLKFTITDGDWSDGFFTLGTKNETDSPLEGKDGTTFYGVSSGDWDDNTNWSLQENGWDPTPYTPSTSPTSAIDKVVIKSTITVSTNDKINASIEVLGTLDLGSTTGHQFDEIKGSGFINIEGDNFPDGDATRFVSEGMDEGIVVVNGSGFTMTKSQEFYNMQINLDNSSDVVTLLNDLKVNGDLTINTGTLQINDNSATTNLNCEVHGELLIASTGLITTGTAEARHQLNLYGDLTNNGSITFTNLAGQSTSNEATNGIVDVNFLNDDTDQDVTLNGSSIFYRIEIDKGIDDTYVVILKANNPSNFKLWGFANQSHGSVEQLTTNDNALGLITGSVKVGSNISISPLSIASNYNISKGARLWVDGGSVLKNSGNAIVPYGTLQVSSGTFEANVSSGITTRGNGSIKVEGGILNTNVIRTSVLGSANVGGYNQSGGYVTIHNPASSTSDYYHFNLTYPGNVFTMSGGTLHVKDARSNDSNEGGIFIASDPQNINVTGGTVIAEITSTSNAFKITSKAPFWNLILRNTNDNTTHHILDAGTDINGSSEADLVAQPLVVLNDLTIESDAFLDHNGKDITVGRNFTIDNDAQEVGNNFGLLYNAAKPNMLTFNGSEDGIFRIEHETDDAYELHVWDMTINKLNNSQILIESSTEKEPPNASEYYNRILRIRGDGLIVENGTLNQGKQSIRVYALITVTSNGILGVYEHGVTERSAYIMLKDDGGGDTDLNTEEGAEIGNLKLNPGSGNSVSISSNVHIKRIGFYNGMLNLKNHKLRLDYLHKDGSDTNYDSNNGSVNEMIYSDANASDGGIELKIPAGTTSGTTLSLPLGTTTTTNRYTPCRITIQSLTTIDGYIQVRPVDAVLQTTNLGSTDKILSYYWRVGYEGFNTVSLPSIAYQFRYDTSDDDDSDEGNFVPGKVLDENPYTRSTPAGSINTGNNNINFTATSIENANYTAAGSDRFTGSVKVFYTRRLLNAASANWETTANWTFAPNDLDTNGEVDDYEHHDSDQPEAGDYPQAGDIAVIGWVPDNDPNYTTQVGEPHGIEVNSDVYFAELQFYQMLDGDEGSPTARKYYDNFQFRPTICMNPSGNLLGSIIGGEGMFWCRSTGGNQVDPDFSSIDIGDFVSEDSSYIVYESTSSAFIYDNIPSKVPNLMIAGNDWGAYDRDFEISTDLEVQQDFELLCDVNLVLSSGASGDITVKNDLKLFELNGKGGEAEIAYPNDASRTIEVEGDLIIENNQGIIHVRNPDATVFPGSLIVHGNITQNTTTLGGLQLYTAATDDYIDLTLTGEGDHSYNVSSGDIANFNNVTVNKGTDISSSFSFNSDFNLNGTTNGATKALTLSNGNLIINHADISFNLTTGGDDFYITPTTGLEINDGSLFANGNSGINLDGKIKINGGSLDMSGVGEDNYIEYSASGNAEIEILSGNLTIASQLRGSTSSDDGILKYTQEGGTVIVGLNSAPEGTKGIFEIFNTGSSFTFTDGSLEIVRSNNSTTRPALYLLPAASSIGSDMIVRLGNASTPTGQDFGVQASVAIPNLEVDNSSGQNPTVTIWNQALEVDNNVSIETGGTLDADGWDISIGGDFENNGVYTAGSNTSYFSGTSDQNLSGTGTFTFNNFNKNNTNDLYLNKTILITGNLTIDGGSFNDNGNTVTLKGDLINYGAINYGGSGSGILMNGTALQKLSSNGNIGKLTIDNSDDVECVNGFTPTITSELKINSGIFDIGENLLTLDLGAEVTTDNSFSDNTMIQTTKSYVDAGVKKVMSQRAEDGDSTLVLMPMGSNGIYTPIYIYVKGNGNNTGSITVKASHETHPTLIDDVEAPDNTEIVDEENALRFYWVLRSDGITSFTGQIQFHAHDSLAYTKAPSPYSQTDYITARLLNDGSYQWDKFEQSSYNESTDVLSFFYTGTNDAGISGDYTAGVEPQTGSKKGAIPDDVPLYTSNGPGTWSDDIWTPTAPAGGPRGSRVQIDHEVTLEDFTSIYTLTIGTSGRLSVGNTKGNRLGDVVGTGTLHLINSDFPFGLFEEFVKNTGGTIEFGGAEDYTILGSLTEANSILFSGDGERYLPNADVTFTGDITIDGASTLEVINTLNKTYSLNGNLSLVSGSFNAGTGTNANLIFNGTSTQSINGDFTSANSSALYNLTIDNPQGVTVEDNLEIDKALVFTNGIISPNAATGKITIMNPDIDAVSNANTNSYVNGKLHKYILDNGSFAFPVGNATQYKPIEIIAGDLTTESNSIWEAQYTGASGISAIKTDASDQLISVSAIDSWTLGCPTGANGQVLLNWNAHSDLGASIDLDNLRVAKLDGTEWYSEGQTARSGDYLSGNITSNANVGFSVQTFTLGTVDEAILPIELTEFTAEAYDESVDIRWVTATETNNDIFELERSVDGIDFTPIYSEPGAGNSTIELFYNHEDKNPIYGTSYYRLKQTDYDGTYSYSDIISVDLNSKQNAFDHSMFDVYPNPFAEGQLQIAFKAIQPNTSVQLSIYSVSGQQIIQTALLVPESGSINLIPIMIDNLSSGVYLINVNTNEGTFKQKLFVE